MPERNVRSATIRKAGRDGNSLTPTEKRLKDKAMRQFCKGDGVKASTEAYREGHARMFGEDKRPEGGRYVWDAEQGKCVRVGDVPARFDWIPLGEAEG